MKKTLLLLVIFLNFKYSYADNQIVYIDINKILNHSVVGQKITQHIQSIKEKKNQNFSLIEKKLLEKENDKIKKKKYN